MDTFMKEKLYQIKKFDIVYAKLKVILNFRPYNFNSIISFKNIIRHFSQLMNVHIGSLSRIVSITKLNCSQKGAFSSAETQKIIVRQGRTKNQPYLLKKKHTLHEKSYLTRSKLLSQFTANTLAISKRNGENKNPRDSAAYIPEKSFTLPVIRD